MFMRSINVPAEELLCPWAFISSQNSENALNDCNISVFLLVMILTVNELNSFEEAIIIFTVKSRFFLSRAAR